MQTTHMLIVYTERTLQDITGAPTEVVTETEKKKTKLLVRK